MVRSALLRGLFVVIGAAVAGVIIWWRQPNEPAPPENAAGRSHLMSGGGLRSAGEGAEAAYRLEIEQRLERLEARLAEAAAERHGLEERLDAIATQLAARSGGSQEAANAAPASGAPPAPAGASMSPLTTAAGSKESMSTMERALAAAGLDAGTAADIKRHYDELTMAEMYLRNQATREQWLDTPRFAAEMAAINAQRTPLRTEIGDDAYDRYLFALGEPNRIRIDDVLQQSPAAQAGLQTGDLVVRYGDARLFTPGELVNETRSGTAGEVVQLEIIRNGQRLAVEVPRGPLGLRIAATQGTPDAS